MSRDRELEARLWCPKCREDHGEIWRVRVGNDGVFVHQSIPEQIPKVCPCGANVERKRS